jgi:ribosome biogenesis GTPase / thiamine phosphate phosphatase
MFDLKTIGATGHVFQQFQPYLERGLVLGRVSAVHREQYLLYTEKGEMAGEAIGALLYRAANRSALPAVGDWVAADLVGPDAAMIHEVLPRRSKFSRRAAGPRDEEQLIAANIDLVFIVCGLDHDFNSRRIERYLTLGREGGAEAVVMLSKADLCEPADLKARIEEARQISGDVPVISISALSEPGAAPVHRFLGPGRTVALIGSSGSGKSTLVNRLLGENRQPTQEVRENDSRGRHTTTFRELIPLPAGGALIDTPGMRELQLWASEESLDSTFGDIAELALQCRFGDCSHDGESDCAVAAAVADGRIDPARWESYRKLRAEVRWHELETDPVGARARKQRWKAIHKAMRAHYKRR